MVSVRGGEGEALLKLHVAENVESWQTRFTVLDQLNSSASQSTYCRSVEVVIRMRISPRHAASTLRHVLLSSHLEIWGLDVGLEIWRRTAPVPVLPGPQN
jgi:hypothetical protein